MVNNSFLLKEYEINFEQLSFYDSRQADTFKYFFTLTSAVVVAQFAIYKLQGATEVFYACLLAMSSIVFVASVLLYTVMLQNRIYFVLISRHLNAIRGYFLKKEVPDFKENQLSISTDVAVIKSSSIHIIQLVGASLISSMFAVTIFYSLRGVFQEPPLEWEYLLLGFIIMVFCHIFFGCKYLNEHGKKKVDQTMHIE